MSNIIHTKQVAGHEVRITDYLDGRFSVVKQAINPKTGKAWQAVKFLYIGENKAKAFRAYLYAK